MYTPVSRVRKYLDPKKSFRQAKLVDQAECEIKMMVKEIHTGFVHCLEEEEPLSERKNYPRKDEGGRTAVYRGFENRKISHRDHVTHSFFLASHPAIVGSIL